MADRVAPISAVSYPTDSFRELLQALDGGQQGVVNSGDLAVSQHAGSPAMNVDVAAGYVLLNGILSSVTQGMYGFLKDAVQTYTIAAADPTNPRRDLVCAVITDSVYAVDGTPNTQNVRVLTGTPAGSPVDPAIPGTWAAYVILARVAVAANATSIVNANITDLRTRAYPKLGAGGFLGTSTGGTPQGSITTNVDVTGSPVTVTVPANRRIKITFIVNAQSTANDNGVAVVLQEGATTFTSCVILHGNSGVAGTNGSFAILTPSAGTHTYKLTAQNYVGGTATVNSFTLLVEDIGPV
jgi:hypothetical protein